MRRGCSACALPANEAAERATLLDAARQSLRTALRLAPEDAALWSLLGVVTAQAALVPGRPPADAARLEDQAIQAFQAATARDRSVRPPRHHVGRETRVLMAGSAGLFLWRRTQVALTWANLGLVHLRRGELEQANNAFSNAQMADPTWTTGWAGQALLAERLGSDETTDLLAHTVDLANGTQVRCLHRWRWARGEMAGVVTALCRAAYVARLRGCQADLGVRFALHVYNRVGHAESRAASAGRERDHSHDLVLAAYVALVKAVELAPANPVAWNLLGLLAEVRRRLRDQGGHQWAPHGCFAGAGCGQPVPAVARARPDRGGGV